MKKENKNLLIATLIFLAGVVMVSAVSYIDVDQLRDSDSSIIFDMANAQIHNITRLNDIHWVIPGNAADIQTKLDLCDGTTACKVIIPCGDYAINYLPMIPSNTHLEGSGKCTHITDTGISAYFKSPLGAENITISDIYFDDLWSAYYPMNGSLKNINIRNNWITQGSSGMIVINGTNIIVRDNVFENVFNGIQFSRAETASGYIKIMDNTLLNYNRNSSGAEFGEGMDINHYSPDIIAYITGNHVIGFRENGIECNVGTCLITDNYVVMKQDETRTNYAILASNGVNTDNGSYGVISNNVILNASDYGIYTEGTQEFVISSNTVRCTTNTITTTGIYSSGRNTNIIGNTLDQCNVSMRLAAPSGYNNNLVIGNQLFNDTIGILEGNNPYQVRIDNEGSQLKNLTVLDTLTTEDIACSSTTCITDTEITDFTRSIFISPKILNHTVGSTGSITMWDGRKSGTYGTHFAVPWDWASGAINIDVMYQADAASPVNKYAAVNISTRGVTTSDSAEGTVTRTQAVLDMGSSAYRVSWTDSAATYTPTSNNETFWITVYRDGTNANDDYGDEIYFRGIRLRYTAKQ